MVDEIEVRIAAAAEAAVIARHRVAMFRDMGGLPAARATSLLRVTEQYLQRAIETGEYVGWLAAVRERPQDVIAGAGLHLRPMLPCPRLDGSDIDHGPQGLIVSVYTEPTWRRRGIARRLVQDVLQWARARGVHNVVLHASPAGRPLYESLGFRQTSEMRHHEGEPQA